MRIALMLLAAAAAFCGQDDVAAGGKMYARGTISTPIR